MCVKDWLCTDLAFSGERRLSCSQPAEWGIRTATGPPGFVTRAVRAQEREAAAEAPPRSDVPARMRLPPFAAHQVRLSTQRGAGLTKNDE